MLLLLPRPGIAAALSLMLTVVLIAFSRFKFDILQLSITFLDFLIIDRDTFSFLLSVFPQAEAAAAVRRGSPPCPCCGCLAHRSVPDQPQALARAAGGLPPSSISAMAIAVPEQPWEPFQGVNHISNLARSGVVAVSRLSSTGWIEADPPSQPRCRWRAARLLRPAPACRRPAIATQR